MFIGPHKTFKRPPRADVLIYDREGSDSLTPFVERYNHNVLSVRGEDINLYCLAKSFFKRKFWFDSAFETYIFCYINIVRPRVVITFIDNDSRFYKISSNCPFTKTIFVQNGRRGKIHDIFGSIDKNDQYKVDYMLVAGDAVGRKFREFIQGETISIGSLRNNRTLNSNDIQNNKILFISSWVEKPKHELSFRTLKDGTEISWEDYFKVDEIALKFLDKWCHKNDKVLQICARSSNDLSGEKEFYKERLNHCEWEFLSKDGDRSTYDYLAKSYIVVFIDSTVGYESLSRGKRTAAFVSRVIGQLDESEHFGWPANLPKTGRFWSHKSSEEEFGRIMDYLNSTGNEDWEKERQRYTPEIMVFDAGNQKLIKLLDELLNQAAEIAPN
jgi:surface carbohydrate biosynthesis protein